MEVESGGEESWSEELEFDNGIEPSFLQLLASFSNFHRFGLRWGGLTDWWGW